MKTLTTVFIRERVIEFQVTKNLKIVQEDGG